MLGKIINYKIENNKIIIAYQFGQSSVSFINEDIVRFFINFVNDDY